MVAQGPREHDATVDPHGDVLEDLAQPPVFQALGEKVQGPVKGDPGVEHGRELTGEGGKLFQIGSRGASAGDEPAKLLFQFFGR